MTNQEHKQLKGYITPRPEYYGKVKRDGTRDYNMRISILRPCMARIGSDAREDLVESVIMDVYSKCLERDKFYGAKAFIRTVRTYYMRRLYRERGLTQRGTKPVYNEYAYIGNIYNEQDENIIEMLPESYEWEMEWEDDNEVNIH